MTNDTVLTTIVTALAGAGLLVSADFKKRATRNKVTADFLDLNAEALRGIASSHGFPASLKETVVWATEKALSKNTAPLICRALREVVDEPSDATDVTPSNFSRLSEENSVLYKAAIISIALLACSQSERPEQEVSHMIARLNLSRHLEERFERKVRTLSPKRRLRDFGAMLPV